MKKTFLIANGDYFDQYIAAYEEILGTNTIYYNTNKLRDICQILFAKPGSVVFIENIHKLAWLILLRIDLRVVHIPRGGGTYKVGWRHNGCSAWIRLKLWRRNRIVVSSKIFVDYLAHQEFSSSEKFILSPEPIIVQQSQSHHKPLGKKILIALSECTNIDELRGIAKEIETLRPVVVSYHPILGITSTPYSYDEIDVIITDCTTIAIHAKYLSKRLIVISETQNKNRALWRKQSEFFDRIISREKKLIVNAVTSEHCSYLLHDLTPIPSLHNYKEALMND